MSGQARVRRDTRSLEVANLADHNDVRRLTQDRAQPRRKGHADLRIHRHLVDPIHLIFNRLFNRDDLAVWFIDLIEARVKRAHLAASGWASNKKNPGWPADDALEDVLIIG